MTGDQGEPDEAAIDAAADDLVKFFEALAAATRRDYDALAEKDKAFGEDVAAERRGAGA